MKKDLRPIDETCECPTCKKYTRSFINTVSTKEEVGCHLITTHNIYFLLNMMKTIHKNIKEGTIEKFANEFLQDFFHEEKKIPGWVIDALKAAKINVSVYQ